MGQPTNLAATPGIGEVTLEWTPAANADLHPAVWLPAGTANIRWRVVGNDGLAAATIDGLEPGHNYYFVVVAAQIGVAWSKASNLVTAIVMAAPSAESGGQSTASATNTDAGDDRLPTAPGYSAVSAGGKHTCRLDAAGIATCWGANGDADKGQANPPDGTFTVISAGYEHTCGLRPDGTAVCWAMAIMSSWMRLRDAIPPSARANCTLAPSRGRRDCLLGFQCQ